MKALLNSSVLRQNPVRGTIIFAVLYAAASFSFDWMFRWNIPNNPAPPLWSVVVTIGIDTMVSSTVVYLLLSFSERQQQALEELNHELRNALQILSYAVPQCDGDTRPQAEGAIESMSSTLRQVSQRLGMVTEKKFNPRQP